MQVSAAKHFILQRGNTSTDLSLKGVYILIHIYVLADCRLGEVLAGKDRGDRGPSGKQFFMSQEATGRIEVSSQQIACEQPLTCEAEGNECSVSHEAAWPIKVSIWPVKRSWSTSTSGTQILMSQKAARCI